MSNRIVDPFKLVEAVCCVLSWLLLPTCVSCRLARLDHFRGVSAVFNFTKCPFCAGHETVSAEAADAIGLALSKYPFSNYPEGPLKVEIDNIRNAILNQAERAKPIDPLLE